MENKSTFLPALQFGVLSGFVLIVFTLALFLIGVNDTSKLHLLSFVFYLGVMVWGIYNIRDKQLDGIMNYGKAFVTGFWIALFSTIIIAIFTFFYLKYIDPGAINRYLDIIRNTILNKKPDITTEQLSNVMNFQRKITTPFVLAIRMFILDIVVGTILSLIIAIFAKREDKTIA